MKMMGTRKELIKAVALHGLNNEAYEGVERNFLSGNDLAPWGPGYAQFALPEFGSFMSFRKAEDGSVNAHVYPDGNPNGYSITSKTITQPYILLKDKGILKGVKQFLREQVRIVYSTEYEVFEKGHDLGHVTGKDEFRFGLSREGQGLLLAGTIYVVGGDGSGCDITIKPDNPADPEWSGRYVYPVIEK